MLQAQNTRLYCVMSLFAKPDDNQPPSAAARAAGLPPARIQISLSAEQKAILDTPVVEKLLRKRYGDRAAAEKALRAQDNGSGDKRHVVQDANGFWRIADGPAPEESVSPPAVS
jgi:hypothetical protein